MSVRSQRFVPKKGSSANLDSLPREEGVFIVTTDDRRIYLDAKVNDVLMRLPLGGDFATAPIPWETLVDKPFEAVSADFVVVPDNNNENTVTLFLSSNLKVTNKAILDKFSENQSGELLYDSMPVGEHGTLVYKSRVDSYSDLFQIESPQEGQVYNVGSSGAKSFNKYIYVIKDDESGDWQPLYVAPDYMTIPNKPSINNVTLEGNKSLSDLGIVSGGYTTKGSSLFADLPRQLTPEKDGWVYNVSDNFITDNRFVEGSGISYSAGTNVVIVRAEDTISYSETTIEEGNPAELGLYEKNNGVYTRTQDTEIVSGKTYYTKVETPTYKFDALSGFVDVSPIDTRVTATQTMIASAFDSTQRYDVGNFVIYDNKFYRCITTHLGDWSAADFFETHVVDEMGGGGGSGDISVVSTVSQSDIASIMSQIWA